MASNSGKAQSGKEVQGTDKSLSKQLVDNGLEDPKGLWFVGATFIFVAAAPLTSFIAQPNGLLEKAVNALCSSVVFLGSAGSTSTVAQTSKIAALSAAYCTLTYAFAGAASAAAIAAGNKEGRNNDTPRPQIQNLRGGPLRMNSARDHMVENLPGYALTAALAQIMAPGDQTLINLLGLHVICKTFLFWPAYVLRASNLRGVAHVLATGTIINVGVRLALSS